MQPTGCDQQLKSRQPQIFGHDASLFVFLTARHPRRASVCPLDNGALIGVRVLYRLRRLNYTGTWQLLSPSVHSCPGQRVEVTEPPMVLRARSLGWSREAAATTLVARASVTPFGRLRLFPPSRARCYCDCQGERSMTRHKRKGNGLPSQLAAVNLHAAGIDIGAQEHWVAVPPESDAQPVRRFGAWTVDLEALADWLQQCR